MERIETVLGNVHDDSELAKRRRAHAEADTLERVVIDAARRRRSRFRATTDAGTEVGVVLDRPALSVGDVLLCEDERMLVVAFEPRDALAVDLPEATPVAMDAAVELGHRVGNQHWDLAVEDGTVYVPLEADRHIVERLVDEVVPGSTVRETTVDAEVFLTDGDAIEHEYGHSQQHERKGEHSHGHSHSHADGHSHTHPKEHSDGHEHQHNHEHGHDH